MNSKRRTHNAIVRRLDKIAAALDRIATALEAMPDTCNIFRIGNVEGDVTNNNGMNAGNNYGNSESQRGNGNESTDNRKQIEGVQHSFNNNADGAIKDLTSALAAKHKQAPD